MDERNCNTGMTHLDVVKMTGREIHGDEYDDSAKELPPGFGDYIAALDHEIAEVLERVRQDRRSQRNSMGLGDGAGGAGEASSC